MLKRITTVFALVMLTMTGVSCAGSGTRKNAQKADDYAEISVTYEVVAQQVEEVKRKDKDLMRLDIGKTRLTIP